MAGAGAWLLLGTALAAAANAAASTCPDACTCFRDTRLLLAFPREDTLSARCMRRGLNTLPTGLDGDVRHLDLSGNWMVRLREGGFLELGLERLLSVDLSSNVLDDVEPGAFRGMRELRRVSLAYNRIQTLPADLFAEAPDLWSLSLAGNPLVIPSGAPFLFAPSLRQLDVSDCKLRVFPDRLLGEDNALEELIASRNGYAEVRVAWLRHLRRLDVSDNHLRNLPNKALHEASQLRSLVLDGNSLRISNHSLVSSSSLRSLSAARCGLGVLHDSTFTEVPQLEELALDSNGLMTLPEAVFSTLAALARVNLRANRLEGLPNGIFSQNTALRALDLSYNLLDTEQLLANVSVEENPPWLEVKSLRELSLSHCGLRSLPANLFIGVPTLRNLTVSGNFLRTVEANLIDPLPKLRSLDLRENPLYCDAKLHGLWLAVEARNVRTIATCMEPPGDWEMLRFFSTSNSGEPPTGASNQSIVNLTTPMQDGLNIVKTAALSDIFIENSLRWGPPVGVVIFAVLFVIGLRKWMNRMNVKNNYYDSCSRESVYDYDEDETVTMTMTTDAGTPRVTPTAVTPPASTTTSRGSFSSQTLGPRFAVPGYGEDTPLTDTYNGDFIPIHRPRLSVGG